MISMNSSSRAPSNTRRWLSRQSDRLKGKSRLVTPPPPATVSEEFSFIEQAKLVFMNDPADVRWLIEIFGPPGVAQPTETFVDKKTAGNSGVSSISAALPKDILDTKLGEPIQKIGINQDPSLPEAHIADHVIAPAIPVPTLWENALSQLRDDQRKILEDFGIQNTSSIEEDIGAIRDLRNGTDSSDLSGKVDKKPTITRARIHGILRKMEKYIIIGDIALQQNPNIVALVWAGVRFCLTVALNDLQTFDGVSSALDNIAGLMGSCRTYEGLYKSSQLSSAKPVIVQVQQLYVYCLRFMADSINYFNTAGPKRFAEGITNPFQEKFGYLIGDIDTGMKTLVQRAGLASQEYQKEEFKKLGGKIDGFRADMSKLLVEVDKTKQRGFLIWLSEINFTAHHEKTRDLRFDNTGNWMFGKSQWVKWIETDASSIMWIHGKAGSGKTVLSSLVIDALTETYQSTPTIFFYCNYGEEERGDASFVVKTLLKQLSMRSENLDQHLLSIFDKGIALSMEPAEAALKAALARFDETFIVVDALDECSKEERKWLVSLFTRLVSSKSQGVKILLTSRPENDLHQLLNDTTRFLIDANDTAKDIRPFVESVLTDHITSRAILDGSVSPDLKRRLIDTISQQADGMFLWAKLQLDHICGEPNEVGVIAQLGRLPSGLDDTYHRMWTKINSGSPSEKEWALKTLQWVLHAKRPLSPEEILEATALQVDPESSDITQPASSADYLIRVCGNFVALDVQTNAFRFIHYSVQEFLKQKSLLSTAENLLAQSCFIVLGRRDGDELRNINLYGYASKYWERHSESWKTIDDHRGTLIHNFLLDRERFASWQDHRSLYQGFPSAGYYRLTSFFNLPVILEHLCQLDQCQPGPAELSASLIIAADRGYITVMGHLLDAGADPNSQGGWCRSPLQIASWRGFDKGVTILLAAGADVNAGGGFYGSALNAGIARNSEKVVELLIDAGANTNAEDSEDGPVLRAAVIKGSEKVVGILLTAKANVNAQSPMFTSALYTASRYGHAHLIPLLLKAGAELHVPNGAYSGTALYIAAGRGADKVVELLLAAGADANAKGGRYEFALYYAARNGHLKSMKLLLDAGADVNARGVKYGDALHAAILSSSVECVRLLLEARADFNPVQEVIQSAMRQAVSTSTEEVVEVLLKFGVDVNANYQPSLLNVALDRPKRSARIVELLLKAGADPNFEAHRTTPLQKAVICGFDTAVQLLLAADANPNILNGSRSPLQLAILRNYENIIDLLLADGADPNSSSHTTEFPLREAVSQGLVGVVGRLLNAGADPNTRPGETESSLCIAVQRGNVGIVNLLLNAMVDVNAANGPTGSALQVAAGCQSLEIVELLLSFKADVHAGEGDVHKPESALYRASECSYLSHVAVLLKAGADTNAMGGEYGSALGAAVHSGNREIVQLLLNAGADVNAAGGEFGTALNTAAASSKGVVDLLLEAGADVTAVGGEYHHALQGAALTGSLLNMILLLKAGADVNAAGGKFGSALQAAASRRSGEKFVEALIDAGAEVNALGGLYGSALQAAAETTGSTESVKLLLRSGADPNARGGIYGSALQAAAYMGSKRNLEYLLKAGANVNARGGKYGTVMNAHTHTWWKKKENCVSLLLSWGATVDVAGDSDSE